MHSHKKYDRSFVLLQPESGGFSLDGRKLSGSALLEIINGIGKITVNIQGFKPPQTGVCKMYFINSKDSGAEGVCLGDVETGAGGKAHCVWEFEPANVGGSGSSYDDFNVIALIIKNGVLSQNEIIAPLVGYKNGKVIWKSGFKEYTRPVVKTGGTEETHMDIETETVKYKESGKCADNKQEDEFAAGPAEELEANEAAELSNAPASAAHHRPESGHNTHFEPLSAMLSESLAGEELAKAKGLNDNLIKTVSEEKYGRFMKSLVTIMEYVPNNEREHLLLLITETAGLTPNIPFAEREPLTEALAAICEYIPGKVRETAAAAFEGVVSELPENELRHLVSVLQKSAAYFKEETGTEKDRGNRNSSGLKHFVIQDVGGTEGTEQIEAAQAADTPQDTDASGNKESAFDKLLEIKEATADEDYNAMFRERLRDFKERFEGIENMTFEIKRKEASEANGLRAESADETEISAEEAHEKKHGNKRGDHHGHGKYDEQKLYRFFDSRKKYEPFRLPEHSRHDTPGFRPDVRPGFPPAVPPSIPIYDIIWIQITPNDIYLLPEKLWIYAANPFTANAYRRYGHLILGLSRGGVLRRYYLGVPGTYSERERMRALSLGFTSFIPVNGGFPRHGEFGYWILEAR